MVRKIRTAVLLSGRGSNMLALAQAAANPDYPAEISLVLSNIPEALGLQKAADMGISVVALDHTQFKSRKAFDVEMHRQLQAHNIELICCAGYMRILSPWFVAQWPNQILNIHPSLLPKYKGLDTHQRALEAGDTIHGCTVHYVNEELDGGAIVLQETVPIIFGDTVETLAAKVLKIEHSLYERSLNKVAKSFDFARSQ